MSQQPEYRPSKTAVFVTLGVVGTILLIILFVGLLANGTSNSSGAVGAALGVGLLMAAPIFITVGVVVWAIVYSLNKSHQRREQFLNRQPRRRPDEGPLIIERRTHRNLASSRHPSPSTKAYGALPARPPVIEVDRIPP